MLRSHVLDRRPPPAQRLIVHRRDAIEIVGAEGQRHLRELRPVLRPVHLDGLDGRQHQPRQRHRAHVLVARRRHGDRLLARQRIHRVDRPETSARDRGGESASSNGRRLRSDSAATGSEPAGRHPRRRADASSASCSRSTGASAIASSPARFSRFSTSTSLPQCRSAMSASENPVSSCGPASIRASAISASASSSVAGSAKIAPRHLTHPWHPRHLRTASSTTRE